MAEEHGGAQDLVEVAPSRRATAVIATAIETGATCIVFDLDGFERALTAEQARMIAAVLLQRAQQIDPLARPEIIG